MNKKQKVVAFIIGVCLLWIVALSSSTREKQFIFANIIINILLLMPIFIIGFILIYAFRDKKGESYKRENGEISMSSFQLVPVVIVLIGIMNIIAGAATLLMPSDIAYKICFSALSLTTGIGLIKFKKWARILELVLIILGFAASIIFNWFQMVMWLYFLKENILRFIIGCGIIYFFLQPQVKKQFKK